MIDASERAMEPIIECEPDGWLLPPLMRQLRDEIAQRDPAGGATVLISGSLLRYRDVAGLAAFVEMVADLTAAGHQVWLCHLPPDLLAALRLARLGQHWRVAPDTAAARERIARHAARPANVMAIH